MSRSGENIYKRKDGRWEGRYIKGRKPDGSIHYGYVYHHSYKEMKKRLFEYKLLYKDNYLHIKKNTIKSISFSQWAAVFLEQQQNKVRYNTYLSYQSKLNNHLIPYLGELKLTQLTAEKLQCFINELADQLAASSIRAIVRVLRTCLNQAMKFGYLENNPTTQLELPEMLFSNVRAFTSEEQNLLEQVMLSSGRIAEKYFPIYLALYSGVRIGELAGLQWSDIDWENQTILIRNNIQRIKSSPSDSQLAIAELKTKSSKRIVPLTKEIYNELQQQYRYKKSPFIITGRGNGPIDPRTLRYRFSQLEKEAGVEKLPFHSLRHTFATRCIEAGVPITTVSDLLGHRSVKMTLDTYTNSFLNEKRSAIEKLTSQKRTNLLNKY